MKVEDKYANTMSPQELYSFKQEVRLEPVVPQMHQIITDLPLLEHFIHDVLPDLGPNERFYFTLMARKKYCTDPGLLKFTKSDRTQLRRFLSRKEDIVDKIRQLEIPVGNWKLKGTPAPQESLALYVTPNPRCMKKSAGLMMKKLVDFMVSDPSGNYHIHAEALSCVQRSKSYSAYVDFDVDSTNPGVIDVVSEQGLRGCSVIVSTRGGYHILVKPKEAGQVNKHWHPNLITALREFDDGLDNVGDQLLPLPGTSQGGFTPYVVGAGT